MNNINKERLLERIKTLSAAKGVSPSKAFIDSRVGKNFISNLKTANPSEGKLTMLANYFGVSIEYLIGESDEILPIKKAPGIKPNAEFLEVQNIHMIPLFESVSAGFGASAYNDIVDYIPMYIPNPHEANETLCIKVVGNSMAPKIEHGDIIQVHKQDLVDSGSIAVVLVDGEDALVKTVTYGEGWLELRSLNPLYKPMRFNGPAVNRVAILGAVKKIIKDV